MATSPSRLCQFAQTSLKIDARPPPESSPASTDSPRSACKRITSSSTSQGGQPVAEHRVVDGAVLLRQRDDAGQLAGEADDLAQHRDAALEAEQRHRDPPAVAGLADDQVGGRPGAGEEHLVELRAAGQLLDRPDVDAVLVDRDEQERQPVVPLRAGLAAGDDEEPLRELRVGRPDLLAVEHPLAVVEPGLGLHVGQVGAGAGLGVALGPQLLDGQDLGQEPLLLLVGPERHQRRTEQLLAEVVDPRGGVGPCVLLVEDHLLPQREAAAAVLLGPADAGPAVLGEVPVPGQPLLDRLVLLARAAEPLDARELAGQVVLEPRPDLGPEGLVLGGVAQVHVWYSTKQMLGLETAPCAAPRGRGAVRRPSGLRRGLAGAVVRRPARPRRGDRCRLRRRPVSARGDRVVLWGPNSIDWAVAALAVSYAGGVLVPVNSRYVGAEVADVVARTGAALVVVHDGFLGRDQVRELADAGVSRPGRHALDQRRSGRARPHDLPEVGPDDVADILFTSGTTGRSKGAMSAHRQTIGVARAWAELGGVRQDDRYLVVNPFFHSFGYKIGIVVGLLTGGDALPGGDLRRRRDDAADRVRADHRLPRRADALPVAAQRARPRRARPVLAAARGHRRGRRTRGADREDAGRAGDRPGGDGVRHDRGGRGDDVPRRRLRRDRGDHQRPRDPGHGDADRRQRASCWSAATT